MRIGHGYDAHRFEAGKPLVLGGVKISHDYGLLAHSDGDVLLHALCDALLGSIGEGDIGQHFPDSSDDYANIDSRVLLRHVYALVQQKGFKLGNTDLTIIAQAPKLSPYLNGVIYSQRFKFRRIANKYKSNHYRRNGLRRKKGRY